MKIPADSAAMASSAYAQSQEQVQQMIAQVKTLTVEKLKILLRTENLTVGGVKSELQIRTIARKQPIEFNDFVLIVFTSDTALC